MKLLETLTHFNGGSSVSELCEKFSEIASVFLYGGYIDVNNMYKIYIKTVEFYFHSEAENGVHDPIVYHTYASCTVVLLGPVQSGDKHSDCIYQYP